MSSRPLPTRLLHYLLERFNPILFYGLSLAFSLAAADRISFPLWLLSSSALFLYLLQLRISDEHRDFDHDRRYYPGRPVPRGLVSLTELSRFSIPVYLLQFFLLVVSSASAVWFLLLQAYAFIMSHQFWAEKWLHSHFTATIFLYEISVIPLFMYVISFGSSGPSFFTAGSFLTALFLGLSFFSLEIGRKVRSPDRLVGQDTYLEQYGFRGTAVLAGLVLSGAWIIGYLYYPAWWIFWVGFAFFAPAAIRLATLPNPGRLHLRLLQALIVFSVTLLLFGKIYSSRFI